MDNNVKRVLFFLACAETLNYSSNSNRVDQDQKIESLA